MKNSFLEQWKKQSSILAFSNLFMLQCTAFEGNATVDKCFYTKIRLVTEAGILMRDKSVFIR